MRKMLCLGAMVLGLALCGSAHGQVTTTRGASGSFVVSRVPTSAVVNPRISSTMQSPFKLRDLFANLTGFFSGGPKNYPAIPDPGSPDYLKAFGFQKFGR